MLMQKFSGEAVARGRIMLMPRLSTRVLRHSRGHRSFFLTSRGQRSYVPHHPRGLRYRPLKYLTRVFFAVLLWRV